MRPSHREAGIRWRLRKREPPTRRRCSARSAESRRASVRRSAIRLRRAPPRRRRSPRPRSKPSARTRRAGFRQQSERYRSDRAVPRGLRSTTRSSGAPISGLAASLLRLGRPNEAKRNWDEALRSTDRMTDREKLRTFGGYYLGIAPQLRQGDRDLRGAGREVSGRFCRPQQPGGRALQQAQFRQGARAWPEGDRDLSEDLQVPLELCALCDVRRRLLHRRHDRAGTDRGGPEDRRRLSPAGDGGADLGRRGRARTTYEQAAKAAGDTGASLGVMRARRHRDVRRTGCGRDRRAAGGSEARSGPRQHTSAPSRSWSRLPKPTARAHDGPARQEAMARARELSNQDSVLVPAARLAIAAGRLDEARAIAVELDGACRRRAGPTPS